MKNVKKTMSVMVVLLAAACSTNKSADLSTTALSADKPAEIVSLVASGVQAAGAGMTSNSASSLASKAEIRAQLSPAICDVHGYPLNLNQSDANYPGYLTYCFMTVDSGDTVYGGFSLAKSVACAVEQAGIQFDGVAQDVTVPADSPCFSNGQGPAGQEIHVTATGTSPAAFNTNFDKGVVIVIPDMNMTFKIAANVSSGNVSFITEEVHSDGSVGATSGSLDTNTGDLRYEARVERLNCATNSSCGWNRHSRIYAKLSMVNQQPVGVENISFAYSNIQAPPGQMGYGGVVISASGNLTTGVKAKLFQATNGSGQSPAAVGDYDTVSNWVEVANSKCYTQDSDSATTCDAGMSLFSDNTKFLMHQNGYTSYDTWFSNLTELSFTSTDLNSDVQ